MKPPITVIGSSNTDMVIQVRRLPCPGETVLGGTFMQAAGGKGANQAVAAARAGGAVTFIARLGADHLGDQAIQGFAREGIQTDFIQRTKQAASGVALIFVAKNGENSIAVASGANALLCPPDIRKARQTIAASKAVLLQLETPLETVLEAATLARRAGARVILNPAPARKLPRELLRTVNILTPNESEAELLTGVQVTSDRSAHKAARKLHQAGVETVIITLGARGAWVCGPGGSGLVPGIRVKAIDTTAAGDVFNGALTVSLSEGHGLPEAVRFANTAAAISVTRAGAQPSVPYRREIQDLLANGTRRRRL